MPSLKVTTLRVTVASDLEKALKKASNRTSLHPETVVRLALYDFFVKHNPELIDDNLHRIYGAMSKNFGSIREPKEAPKEEEKPKPFPINF